MFGSISSSKEFKFGIIRNLSIRYLMIREKLNINYSKENNIKSYISDNSFNNFNNKFTSNLISSKDKMEMENIITPKYMEIYEQCDNLLKDFDVEFNKLKEEQQKRIVPNFNETESKLINQNIHMISNKMTQKLQKCKQLTKELKNLLVNTDINENVKFNMYHNLLNRLAETSRALQINEEMQIQKYQEFNTVEDSFFHSCNNYDSIETTQTQNFNSNNPKKLDVAKERNKELDLMVKTVNDLKEIFQEVSDMIISQGTILDRIDYNLYQSRYNVRRGNREMEETHERLKSGCLRRINTILIIIIFVMSLLLVFKFF
jgi:syntaxin 16